MIALSSARGDQVFLSQATGGGALTGYRSDMDFGPAANGVSFGRYVTSDARVDFPARERISDSWARMVRERGIELLRQDETGTVTLEIFRDHWRATTLLNHETFCSSSR